MVTRARKQTIPATPFVETVAPEASHEANTAFDYKAYMHKMLDDALNFEAVGWKRQVCAWVLSLSSAFAIGYGMGTLIAYTLVGAMVLSTSAFLAYAIYFVGILLAVYLGSKVSAFVFDGVIDKSIARHVLYSDG